MNLIESRVGDFEVGGTLEEWHGYLLDKKDTWRAPETSEPCRPSQSEHPTQLALHVLRHLRSRNQKRIYLSRGPNNHVRRRMASYEGEEIVCHACWAVRSAGKGVGAN